MFGRLGEQITNRNGGKLTAICETHNLRITNQFYGHKDIHEYTWIQNTKKKLRAINDFFIMEMETPFITLDVRVEREAKCGSDHKPLVDTTKFPWTIRNQPKRPKKSQVRRLKKTNLNYSCSETNPQKTFTDVVKTRN